MTYAIDSKTFLWRILAQNVDKYRCDFATMRLWRFAWIVSTIGFDSVITFRAESHSRKNRGFGRFWSRRGFRAVSNQ